VIQTGPTICLTTGEARLLSGVRIWASTPAGKAIPTAITTSDADGRFELRVPAPGQYKIHARIAPYNPAEVEVEFSPDGCATRNIGLVSGSSISGKVLDRRGQPLKSAKVGLIDIDRPEGKAGRSDPFRTEYSEGPDGSFRFQNVPFGRYILVSNPYGPQSDESNPSPFESSYYPNGVTRDRAEVIEVKDANRSLTGKDLVVGAPVTFRTVTVSVRFPDGQPMTTAAVSIAADTFFRREIQSTNARFQVPTNIKFHIQVTDWYRRTLKKTYESTHEPGSTPVTREFVITEEP
jgi:hypothetical protein